jgi:hypothetical protein
MIIALLALAFAMIVGGLLAALFGWDIVLIERGWTMVIAGSFTAGCGALLLGITAVVSKLNRIQSELSRLQVGFDEELREEAPSSATGLSMAALAGGLLGGGTLGGDKAADENESAKQPDLPLFSNDDMLETPAEREEFKDEQEASKESGILPPFPPRTTADDADRRDIEEESEIKVPDFLLADRVRDNYGEPRNSSTETSLFADEPRLDELEDEQRDDRDHSEHLEPLAEPVPTYEPEPEPAREPQPAPAEEETVAPEEPAQEDSADEEPRSGSTIIGTYNSGENTYVMFADGSIEAQTPRGVFRFQSLDELKAFIASGGEGENPAT